MGQLNVQPHIKYITEEGIGKDKRGGLEKNGLTQVALGTIGAPFGAQDFADPTKNSLKGRAESTPRRLHQRRKGATGEALVEGEKHKIKPCTEQATSSLLDGQQRVVTKVGQL